MKSWNKPTDEMIENALASVRKETDRQFFFSRLKNPLWIQPLAERGYFRSPPMANELPDGYIQFPVWPELQYLKNVSGDTPEKVVEIILRLPEVDNPRVYDDILEIALRLHGQQSAKLKPKILEYVRLERQPQARKFTDLIVHWTAENQNLAALELSKELVAFKPEPHSKDKRARRKVNPSDWSTFLEPLPRIDKWDYEQLLEKGVRPLADKTPFEVAGILISAVANMIRQKEPDHERDEDYSEIWCQRLNKPDSDYEDSEAALVHTLTYACEKVYEKSPESVAPLDGALRNQRWKVFKRLRQHLYALNPNEQTLPWTREFILKHQDYAKWEHHFEFQQMVRKACEHFGADLLNKEEKTAIFDAILSGPSKDNLREWMGNQFTDDKFKQRQRYFHRRQLRPFACLLTGTYQSCFQELESEFATESLSDEDYSPVREASAGVVSYRSPRSPEDLAGFSDEKLLAYINKWQEEHTDENNWLVQINIGALAAAFQTLFKDSVIQDMQRLAFWMDRGNGERIERPVYVKAIVQAIQEHVKEKHFKQLDIWFEFCEWVLSHPDANREEGIQASEESRDHPDWRNARLAVQKFVAACVEQDLNVPFSARKSLAKLLEMLCTQFDRGLDQNEPVLLNPDDQIIEAINSTRSSALQTLFKFGFWVRSHDGEDAVPEVTSTLEARLKPAAERPLAMPERAMLGVNFGNLRILNQPWAIKHKADFFPPDDLTVWMEAFGNFLRFNHPNEAIFEILKEEFKFALDHLEKLKEMEDIKLADRLGQHLFKYYLWGVSPLNGEDSLLEKFYENTTKCRQRWANLFGHVGRSLNNSGAYLDDGLEQRIVAFFDWRLEINEPQELAEFTFWLKAQCLAPDWRLDAYCKTLDIRQTNGMGISIELDVLNDMRENHTAKVVECLAKITNFMQPSPLPPTNRDMRIYIQTKKVKPIMLAGLRSQDEKVRENAERVRENLLKDGRFDILDTDE